MHLHLDLSRGLTGDMFIAAVLDTFPQFEARVIAAVDALDGAYPVICSLIAHSDYEFTGRRFEVEPFDKYFGCIPFAYPVASQGDAAWHEGTSWKSVRQRLHAAEIDSGVRSHAIKIFERLVEAESSVHGIKPDSVAFQEVAAWDAVTEIVGAAALIVALGGVRWTASPPPQDEAVTLTGASIVSYLCPPTTAARNFALCALVGTGHGFASHSSGLASGQMRVLWFDDEAKRPHHGNLMQGLDRVRERSGDRAAP
ncbi:MAG TPA: nickel insertion protein [Steroidobacteraceae bacterium]